MRGEYVMPSMGRIAVGELVADWLCPQGAGDSTLPLPNTGIGLACACQAKVGGG